MKGAVSLGCSSNLSPPSPTAAAPQTPPPAAPAVPCAQYLDGLATVAQEALPATDPLRDRGDVYGAVFADVAARGSERTRQCCTEALTRDDSGGAHRWSCCSALGDATGGGQPMACTPWGPPCPPALVA